MGRDDMRQHADRKLTLARAVLSIAQAHDLPEVMRLARIAARELTGADGVTLVLREGECCRYADEDAIGPLWKGQRFLLNDCISGWTMLHDQGVIVDDIYADPRIPHAAYRATFVQSLSMSPIRRGAPIGAIGCYWARKGGADTVILDIQQALADALALAFQMMELQRRPTVVQASAEHSAAGWPKTQDDDSLYRLLVEQAPDGIFLADAEGRYTGVNQAGADMLGYTCEEVLAHSLFDCVVPEDIARIPAEIARFDEGAIVTSEWLMLRKDGTTFPGEVVGRRLPDGRLQGILRDVSVRRSAERALRESESFNRQTLESIPGMVFTTRPDGFCDYQSQQWVDYTGVAMAEHLGDGWNALLHPGDRRRALVAWRDAVAQRAPYDLEYRVRGRDGVHEWFHVTARPLRDEYGSIVRWFGVATNVERLKRAEDQRIASLEQQRDTLVREVHHRIKNHLQGVTGLLRNAISDAPHIAAPLEQVIGRIRAIAEVHGLQSRKHGGTSGPTLDELVQRAAESAAGPVSIESVPDSHGSSGFVFGDDAVAIALVLNEILTNAVKHGKATRPVSPVSIAVDMHAQGASITIRNAPARLPDGFDFARGSGLGNGLQLVSAMLPTRGAKLLICQDSDGVTASLILGAPVLVSI